MANGLLIDPAGQSVTVTITAATSGASIQLYSDVNATATRANPFTITTPTTVFVRETVQALVSLKVAGAEVATSSGSPALFTFEDGAVGTLSTFGGGSLPAVAQQATTDSATYLPRNPVTKPGAFSSFVDALVEGTSPVGLLILTDSTGYTSGKTRWPALLPAWFQANYPAFGVQTVLWSDSAGNVNSTSATGSYNAPSQDVAPPNGAPTVTFASQTVPLDHPGSGATLGADIDLRAKIVNNAWPPNISGTIVGKWSNVGGARTARLIQQTSGQMELQVSADGTATTIDKFSSAWPSQTAGVAHWVRATLTGNNGAGGNDVKFYSSTDGVTWTQVGSTQTTAGTTAPFNASSAAGGGYNWEIGGATGGSSLWTGTLHEVYVLNGIGGKNMVPRYPSSWFAPGATTGITVNGSPLVSIVNGSMPGAGIVYLGAAARIPLMTPFEFDIRGVILACSHNDTNKSGKDYLALWDTWLSTIRTELGANVPVALCLENPRTSPATYIKAHAQRRLDLTDWAAKNNVTLIDVYRAFNESALGLASLVDNSDGIHPTDATGSPLWATTVETAIGLRR